jgi:hypothetical protein
MRSCSIAPGRGRVGCGAFAFEDEVGCEAGGLGLPDDGWRWAAVMIHGAPRSRREGRAGERRWASGEGKAEAATRDEPLRRRSAQDPSRVSRIEQAFGEAGCDAGGRNHGKGSEGQGAPADCVRPALGRVAGRAAR